MVDERLRHRAYTRETGDDMPSVRDWTWPRELRRPMLLDGLLPRYDATKVEHRAIPVPIDAAYEAVRSADFMEAWRGSSAVRFLFAARSLGERAVATVGRRPHAEPPAPESMRLADMPTRGEWVLLGEDPPREIAFGAVGHFWRARPRGRRSTPSGSATSTGRASRSSPATSLSAPMEPSRRS